jgi:hypothetical protein
MTPRAAVALAVLALAAVMRAQEVPEPWRVLRALEVEGIAAFDRRARSAAGAATSVRGSRSSAGRSPACSAATRAA